MELEALTEKEKADLKIIVEIVETAIVMERVGLGPWQQHVRSLTSFAILNGAITDPNKVESERLQLMGKHFVLREANRENKTVH